jgi:hypothetical protein
LVLTDPPYKFGAEGGGIHARRDYTRKLDALHCCDFEPGEIFPLLPTKYAIFCCNKTLLPDYINWALIEKLNWDIHPFIKDNPTPAYNQHFLPDVEYVFVARPPKSFWSMDAPYDCYRKAYTGSLQEQQFHPAQKPLGLMSKYIQVCCPKDGIVLDPFVGSGTTLVAAKALGCKAVGIDVDEACCDLAVQRLSQEGFNFEASA